MVQAQDLLAGTAILCYHRTKIPVLAGACVADLYEASDFHAEAKLLPRIVR